MVEALHKGNLVYYSKPNLHDIIHRSKMIEDWLRGEGGNMFVNLLRRSFYKVHYTMISSLGAQPSGGRLRAQLNESDPKLVLDPFLLALKT